MISSVFSLLLAAGLFWVLAQYFEQLPGSATIAIGLFGLLFCVIAISSARRHRRIIRAKTTQPVATKVLVRATETRRGPPKLVAEMQVGNDTWRASLTAWKHERSLANQSHEGRAWLDPDTGAPLELEIEGKIVKLVPFVVKVDPDSLLEQVIRKVHKFD